MWIFSTSVREFWKNTTVQVLFCDLFDLRTKYCFQKFSGDPLNEDSNRTTFCSESMLFHNTQAPYDFCNSIHLYLYEHFTFKLEWQRLCLNSHKILHRWTACLFNKVALPQILEVTKVWIQTYTRKQVIYSWGEESCSGFCSYFLPLSLSLFSSTLAPTLIPSLSLPSFISFCYSFPYIFLYIFDTRFLCVVLAILELALCPLVIPLPLCLWWCD